MRPPCRSIAPGCKLNILLTGAAGQLGSELLPLLSARGKLLATDRFKPESAGGNWLEMDISDGGALENLLNSLQPGLIVNAAAYTAVDQAETDVETAFDINAEFPARLATWATGNGARLLHYSTDYVFDGKGDRPYRETDLPNPQNVYGESKLAGERAIEALACNYAILRTAWVYSPHGKNFVLSMLDLARKGVPLKIVDDQRGCPTSAKNLALASDAVITAWQLNTAARDTGVFHYCDDGDMSWYEFAVMIFKQAMKSGLLEKVPELAPISSAEYPQPAQRPKWSVLDTGRITRNLGIQPASFERSLRVVIDEIKARAK